jgi:hypothetical protein
MVIHKELKLRLSSVLALLVTATPSFAQYAGPAILSRGEAPSAMTAVQVKFRPFVEVGGTYDNGLADVALDESGQLATRSAFGGRVAWGLSGSKQWKHTLIGLDYRGSTSLYNYYKSTVNLGQSFMLGVTHNLARHVTLTLNEAAGMHTRDFGLLGLPQTVPFDPASTYIPATDFFDNRTYYITSQANLTVQKTARLSFSFGGGLYMVRRRSPSLTGTTGTSANGDVQYRLNRATTIGGGYNFTHFDAVHSHGTTDAHAIVGTFSRRLNRRAEFSGSAGAMHLETKYLQILAIDPVIASILGITSTSQVRHTVRWTPQVEGRLSWVFPQGIAFLSVGRGLTPGNGLFLTSITNTTSAGYVYTGLRRWSFNVQSSYSDASSIQNFGGAYRTVSGQVMAARSLRRFGLHVFASFSARKYASGDFSNYNRQINQATIGLGYSPGDVPLRIW